MIKMIVTGTIGSGKSEVVKLMREHIDSDTQMKFDYIDFDELVNDMYSDPNFQEILQAKFGVSAKKDISKLVFSGDTSKLAELNEIVGAMLDPWFLELSNMNGNLIIEVPYYFEMLIGGRAACAATRDNFTVLCVSMTDEEERIRRIKDRAKVKHPDWTDENIDNIIKSQLPTEIKEALADVIILNDGSVEDLQQKICDFINDADEVLLNSIGPRMFNIDPAEFLLFSRINKNILRVVEYMYSKPERYYHNVNHLQMMIRWLALGRHNGDNVTYSESLLLAILFHDIVYDSTRSDNEKNSVAAMYAVLSKMQPELLTNNPDIVEMAEVMILASISHKIPNSERFKELCTKYNYFDDNLRTFLDLDLIIFIDSVNAIDEYDANIRIEYKHVPSEIYYVERVKVLENLYNRDAIYVSQYFNTELNNSDAKAMINRLINKNKRIYARYAELQNEVKNGQ